MQQKGPSENEIQEYATYLFQSAEANQNKDGVNIPRKCEGYSN